MSKRHSYSVKEKLEIIKKLKNGVTKACIRRERHSYSVKEKLEIIKKVKSGVTKACIRREFGIPEGTVRGWMAEETKLNSFIDKLDEGTSLKDQIEFVYR
ncbi:CENP-B N-terminal DNA-binding domain [Popillia japonica]|uniref:CENP-B N-terminal DNA-binding domain n=1 Tax=Popillia japonica TaxID=7064 RepID=A0AAW1KQ78_POPJA